MSMGKSCCRLRVYLQRFYMYMVPEFTWNTDDEKNPVVVITKDGNEIKIPVNKNIAYVNGSEVKLDGVTVFNGINTYVPQSAIDLIK